MIHKPKPPLIYTIERSGTHFISYCFNHVFLNPINTHNKNKKFTYGEDIDYKNYKVFATIRDPKDIVISEMYTLYEEFESFRPNNEEFVYKAKQFLNKQKDYLYDLIEHKDFYIMPFKYFTEDTYTFFVRLAKENSFSDVKYSQIINNSFFKNPMIEILQDESSNKLRFPREYKEKIRTHIKECMELEDLPEKVEEINKLYRVLLKRYDDGQVNT